MKKKNFPCIRLLLVLLVFASAGCAADTGKNPDMIRIGVALYQQDDTFISMVAQNLEQLAKEKQEENRKLTMNMADGRANQAVQNEQIDRFLAQGYDVICVNIVDRTAAAVIIDKAQSANVPVIFFNRQPVEEDLMRWEHAYYVGSDAEQSGMLQGKIVLNAWRDTQLKVDRDENNILQYVMLEGEAGHQDTMLRTENSVKMLTRGEIHTDKLASDTANWQRGQAGARMKQWIGQFGAKIEVVFANNDDMALGAIDAYLNAGYEIENLPIIVGVDGIPAALDAIAADTLTGTVLNDSTGQANAIMNMAYSLATDTDLADIVDLKDGKYVLLPYRMITKENLQEFSEKRHGNQFSRSKTHN